MKTVGLRGKVLLFVSCLIAAVIAINAVITLITERKEREMQLMEQGRLFARLTATDVVRSYGSLSWQGGPARAEPAQQMARFFSYYPDLTRLSIISESGVVLYDSANPGFGQNPVHTDDPDLVKRLGIRGMDVRTSKDADGQKYMDILAPVDEAGGPQFLKVRYVISYRSLEERLSAIRMEFLLLACFSILAGILAATVLSAKLIRPVLKLRQGAGEIARGNLDYAVDISAKDEIGELGRSFNLMALSLKEHRKSLEEANKNLMAANEELKVLQKELIRSERMAAVGELAAGLSHEIDNPIGVILGFAELLLEDMPQDDPRREDVTTILEESKRCKRIVRGLLDFSRPPVLGVAPTDVNDVIRRTVEAAFSQRLFKKVKVKMDLAQGTPEVMADPDRLKQVFMNLMINAAQSMPEGGDVHVRSAYHPEEEAVKVSVKDSGPGIPADNIGRVFDPFFTTKKPGEGTGLGLAICVRLLEEQGGSIAALSEPGQGATFIVTLPIKGAWAGVEEG
ncbi:MAG TPA: ATP-binding protein [Nitrospirota bacterium]|nr:ATP-binding protein [Nitrospirota bacterium]